MHPRLSHTRLISRAIVLILVNFSISVGSGLSGEDTTVPIPVEDVPWELHPKDVPNAANKVSTEEGSSTEESTTIAVSTTTSATTVSAGTTTVSPSSQTPSLPSADTITTTLGTSTFSSSSSDVTDASSSSPPVTSSDPPTTREPPFPATSDLPPLEPEKGGAPSWAIVLISMFLTFALLFTGLSFLRRYLIRKRREDQMRLLSRSSTSLEGFFYGDGTTQETRSGAARYHDAI